MKIKLAYKPGGALAGGVRGGAGAERASHHAHTLPPEALTLPEGLMIDEVQLLTGRLLISLHEHCPRGGCRP